MTTAHDFDFTSIEGKPLPLKQFSGQPVLIVNVASKCGLTPQYEGLVSLYHELRDQGLVVLGVPSNQFMGQEPGSMEEILEYCTTTWGVTFPIFDKLKVNGGKAAPLYKALKKTRDADGKKGPVRWNFEKFLVTPQGDIHRFRPNVKPDDPAIVEVIEANLPR